MAYDFYPLDIQQFDEEQEGILKLGIINNYKGFFDKDGGSIQLQACLEFLYDKFARHGAKLTDLEDRVCVLEGSAPCVRKGTKILMADGTEKNIEDVHYGDVVKGWDFTNNCQINVKSYGAIRTGVANVWQIHAFENGELLEIARSHALYSKTHKVIKSSSDLRLGDVCMDIYGNDCALIIVRQNVESEYVERYTLLTENCTYFVNNILSGHHARDLYRFYSMGITSFNENITEDEVAFFKQVGDIYTKSPRIVIDNRSYLREIAPYAAKMRKSEAFMSDTRNKLSQLDYKTIKYQQGKLSYEEFEKCCADCEKYRDEFGAEESARQENLNKIREIRAKYGIDNVDDARVCFWRTYFISMDRVRKNGFN
jgi:hypothetical protein